MEPMRSVVRVHLSGELDLASARGVQRRLTELIQSSRPAFVVVDLEGVSFCDAVGFRALEAAVDSVPPPARVVFAHARPIVRRVFSTLDRQRWLLDAGAPARRLPPPSLGEDVADLGPFQPDDGTQEIDLTESTSTVGIR